MCPLYVLRECPVQYRGHVPQSVYIRLFRFGQFRICPAAHNLAVILAHFVVPFLYLFFSLHIYGGLVENHYMHTMSFVPHSCMMLSVLNDCHLMLLLCLGDHLFDGLYVVLALLVYHQD